MSLYICFFSRIVSEKQTAITKLTKDLKEVNAKYSVLANKERDTRSDTQSLKTRTEEINRYVRKNKSYDNQYSVLKFIFQFNQGKQANKHNGDVRLKIQILNKFCNKN